MNKTEVTILIDKYFNVYIPEIYGIDTWGSFFSQESIEYNKDKKKWIIHTWEYGGEWEEDYREEIELDILATFNNDVKARKFLEGQGRKKSLEELNSLLRIYHEFVKAYTQK